MNEQRKDAYLDLIQQLLNCSNEEEMEILAANRDVIDAEFFCELEIVAKMMSEKGNLNTANWLRDFGNQLAEALNINTGSSSQAQIENLSQEDDRAYLQFLMEILQAISESNGDTEIVYPLLVANTDKLNHIFAGILQNWATKYFEEAQADASEYIATVICDFGNLIEQFPLGNKASNIEIAIVSYETVLKIFTQQAFPQDWAMTQNNLGIAYSHRIKGNIAENIENAIFSYKAALLVYTRETFPQLWAKTQYYS